MDIYLSDASCGDCSSNRDGWEFGTLDLTGSREQSVFDATFHGGDGGGSFRPVMGVPGGGGGRLTGKATYDRDRGFGAEVSISVDIPPKENPGKGKELEDKDARFKEMEEQLNDLRDQVLRNNRDRNVSDRDHPRDAGIGNHDINSMDRN